jgi:hypothetical protein
MNDLQAGEPSRRRLLHEARSAADVCHPRPPLAVDDLLCLVASQGTIAGRGMLCTLVCAILSISPTPPLSTTFVAARAKPFTWVVVMCGGIDSALGSVTRSTNAGPGCANASPSAERTAAGCSMRTEWMPAACELDPFLTAKRVADRAVELPGQLHHLGVGAGHTGPAKQRHALRVVEPLGQRLNLPVTRHNRAAPQRQRALTGGMRGRPVQDVAGQREHSHATAKLMMTGITAVRATRTQQRPALTSGHTADHFPLSEESVGPKTPQGRSVGTAALRCTRSTRTFRPLIMA